MKKSRAQIIATLGPSSKEIGVVEDFVMSGVDAFRINFAWDEHDAHKGYVEMIRKISEDKNVSVPVIQDLAGRRRKTGDGHRFDENSDVVLTEKDKEDIEFGAGVGFEYVSLSYVGSAQEVEILRDYMKSVGHGGKVIGKIERDEAVDDIDSIIEVSDAIMVARGDLGNEIPLEEIPFVQQEIVEKANKAGQPVIVATGLLSSMVDSKSPSRADVADISHAISTGADVLLLADETAIGKYPTEAVGMMEKVIVEAEERMGEREIHLL